MGGVFGAFGGDFMLKPSLGVGAQISLRFAQSDYQPDLGVSYRPIFYDFNGIWTPSFGTKRILPEIQAGFGGMSMRFYAGPQYCTYYSCTNFIGSSNHFQLHTSFGFRIYVKERVFVRPQFDYHWVHGLSQELNSDSVMTYTLALGYSF